MNTADNSQPAEAPSQSTRPAWLASLQRLAIWCAFLVLMYLTRDFFFLAFMTFMFSYLALALVGWVMGRLSPNRDRPGMRRLVTLAVFVFVPISLLGVGALVVPRLIAQCQRLAGWASQVSPETEVSRVLEGYVGPSEFRRQYGGPDDPRYQKALEEFRETGERHVAEYLEFSKLEAWVEGGFNRQFSDAETGRIRSRLASEGTSSKDFELWFFAEKVPELQARARKEVPEKGRPSVPVDPLVRAAASVSPEQLLQQVRRDQASLAAMRQDWQTDSLVQGLAAAKQSPAYREQFRDYYEDQRRQMPQAVPYTFDQFAELQKVRPQGRRAFGDALEALQPSPPADREARLRADFEAATKHDLFQAWWGTSSTGKFIRNQVESGGGGGAGRVERLLTSLLNVPVDLVTALLLSFFICIDFPRVQRGCRRLRDTWLRGVYDEMAPALSNLALLVGRSMQAQGLIAVCNATLMFFALTLLGVEHAVLLGGVVFVLCLVPTLGMIMAWVLLAAVALMQPGGGLVLALKVTGAVAVVVLLETLVFSPRILGRMMELHPILIISVLPLAQYFFGVWGLILAMPVTVYVIYEIILRRGLPGSTASAEGRTTNNAPPADAQSAGSNGLDKPTGAVVRAVE